MTRKQKKGLIIASILVALPVLFLVEEHFRGKWALAQLKRQLVAKGEKLTLKECWPPPPESAADNGYPEFGGAAARLGGSSISEAAPRSLRAVAPGRVEVVHNLKEWKLSTDRKKATNNNWRTLEESFTGLNDPLAEARAAIRKPAFDAHLDYARGFSIPLPHLARSKAVAQLLGIDALIQLHNGRLDGAIDDIEAQLLLSRHIRNERLVISQLVRFAIAALAIGPTWQTLQAPGLTDAQLARLQRAWETNDFVETMNQSLEMERAMAVAMFARMRGSTDEAAQMMDAILNLNWSGSSGASGPVQSLDDLMDRIGVGGQEVLTKGLYVPAWQFLWSHQDEKSYLESMQEMLDAGREARRQYCSAPVSNTSRELEKRWEKQSAYSRLSCHVSEQLAAWLSRSPQRAIAMEAQRALAIAAIAIKRYELRHGAVPATLAALVPEFLSQPPRDIFDGQPLRYRPGEGGRYVLYSIGKDERDDGGDPSPPDDVKLRETPSLHFINCRDWVWPMPATDEEIRAAEEKLKQQK